MPPVAMVGGALDETRARDAFDGHQGLGTKGRVRRARVLEGVANGGDTLVSNGARAAFVAQIAAALVEACAGEAPSFA